MSRDQSTEAELVAAQAGRMLDAAMVAGEALEPRDRFDAPARALLEHQGVIARRPVSVQGRQGALFGGGR